MSAGKIDIPVVNNGSADRELIKKSLLMFGIVSMGVAGYIVKPTGYKKLIEMARTIHMYWTLSELPNGS